VGDPSAWIAATGIAPASLAETLARYPAGVQERWFARAYLAKPMAIGSLAVFWIATGGVALGAGRAAALGHLTDAGLSASWAMAVLVATSLGDIALGLAILLRRLARPAVILMLAAAIGYVVVGSVAAPGLWLDPLGPLMKIVPILTALALTFAVLDER
jgi:hypothetical protein